MTRSEYVLRYLRYDPGIFLPLYAMGCLIGRIARCRTEELARVSNGELAQAGDSWCVIGSDRATVGKALDSICAKLASEGLIPMLRGERYRVVDLITGDELATIDRSAAIYFGLRTQGVHLNAYSTFQDRSVGMWLARRALTHCQFPGQLDNLVAGGVAAHQSFEDALREEASEEAGITPAMLRLARKAGALTYRFATKDGLVDSIIMVYDLEVGNAFIPRNFDRRVDSFRFVSLKQVEQLALEHDAFKFNCGLVALDFLDRHGQGVCSPEARASINLLRSEERSSLEGLVHAEVSAEARGQ